MMVDRNTKKKRSDRVCRMRGLKKKKTKKLRPGCGSTYRRQDEMVSWKIHLNKKKKIATSRFDETNKFCYGLQKTDVIHGYGTFDAYRYVEPSRLTG
jgi:hypothetical protein